MGELTREQIEDWRNEICLENGWTKDFIQELHALCDMALSASRAEEVLRELVAVDDAKKELARLGALPVTKRSNAFFDVYDRLTIVIATHAKHIQAARDLVQST